MSTGPATTTPVARSPIVAVPPVVIKEGWEVSGRRVSAAGADTLTLTDCTPLTKVQLRAPVHPGASPIVFHTVPDIPVAANAMTKLVPDSYHLLITGAGPLQDGKDIKLTLTFAHSEPITILALVTNPESGGASYFLN